MISAFARAYQVLDEPQYLVAAERAAAFIRTQLYDEKTGKLSRRHREGQVAFDGYVDDYAFLVQGLLDLYETSFKIEHLRWAFDLQKKQNELFWDKDHAGFFSTTGKDASILLRMKEDYDGAEPSPNSVATLNLLRLAEMLDEKPFREMAAKTLAAFGDRLRQAPSAMPQMMVAFDFYQSKPKQIVIAGKPDAADTRAMLRAVQAVDVAVHLGMEHVGPRAKPQPEAPNPAPAAVGHHPAQAAQELVPMRPGPFEDLLRVVGNLQHVDPQPVQDQVPRDVTVNH